MPIDETITTDGASSEANPAGTVSDVLVGPCAPGSITLQVKTAAGDWFGVSSKQGAYIVATPDPALLYRFKATNVVGNIPVYFGV